MEKYDTIERKGWEEFKSSGLLWFINSILHLFGYAIVLEYNDDGKIYDVYPARTIFRGFDENSNTKGYSNITEYLKNNIDALAKEAIVKKEKNE